MRGLALGLCSWTVSRLSVCLFPILQKVLSSGNAPCVWQVESQGHRPLQDSLQPPGHILQGLPAARFESLIFKMPFKICNLEINCTQMPGLGHAFVEGKDKRQMLRWGFCDRPASDSGRHHVQVFVSQLPWGFQSNNRTFPLGDLQCVLRAEQPLADSCSLVWEGNPHLPPRSHRSRGPARRPWLQKSYPASWVGQVEM